MFYLGIEKDLWKYLEAVCLEDEVRHMPQGEDTVTGETASVFPADSRSGWLWPVHWPSPPDPDLR